MNSRSQEGPLEIVVGFYVSTVVVMKSTIFSNITLFSPLKVDYLRNSGSLPTGYLTVIYEPIA
jgi:hypothetical protein